MTAGGAAACTTPVHQKINGASNFPTTPTAAPSYTNQRSSTTKHSGHKKKTTGMTVEELKKLTSLRLAASQNHAIVKNNNTNAVAGAAAVNLQNNYPLRNNSLLDLSYVSSPTNSTSSSGNNTGRTTLRASSKSFISSSSTLKPTKAFVFNPYNANTEETGEDYEEPPPPPPVFEEFPVSDNNNNSFIDASEKQSNSNSVPSWSPPPAKSKKKISDSSHSGLFFQTSSPSTQNTHEDISRDQNAVIAPPPGLARRPSMTVPWQVAESVLNTPQTTSSRKTIESSTMSSSVNSSIFNSYIPRSTSIGSNHGGNKSPKRVSAPPTSTSPKASSRRGSFGNAAQMFRFRRRSRSRLDFNSNSRNSIDEQSYEENNNQGDLSPPPPPPPLSPTSSSGYMPGISEQDYNATSQFGNRMMMQQSNQEEIEHQEAPHINSSRKSKKSHMEFYDLSIPPPPPLEELYDEKSKQGLPMMSPNGMKLRKVAELARRGSMSSEDKTRLKDEIIQESLGKGGGANIALISKIKVKMQGKLAKARENIQTKQAVSSADDGKKPLPPPGFASMVSPKPRRKSLTTNIPVAIAPSVSNSSSTMLPAGIVRSTSIGRSTSVVRSTSVSRKSPVSSSLTIQLAEAAQRVAECAQKGDMEAFNQAMAELDVLRTQANNTTN